MSKKIIPMSKKIIWIASFPKSGNPLIRAILASLFFTKDGIFSFEILKKILLFENFQRLNFIKIENMQDYKKLSDLKILSKYSQKMIFLVKYFYKKIKYSHPTNNEHLFVNSWSLSKFAEDIFQTFEIVKLPDQQDKKYQKRLYFF